MNSADHPAILGGKPIFPEGPPDWPGTDPGVTSALDRALCDGTWGKYDGGHVERLLERLGSWSGAPHALTCASGTIAVEIALRSLNVEGGEVVMAAYDYPGNFLSVHAAGAFPVLADVCSWDWNLSLSSVEANLGPDTRAVLVSHLHGGIVPMAELMDLCQKRGIPVLEDAAQAPGAIVQGRLAGTWGDVGVLSFGGSKLLTSGRGGAILTARPDVHQRAKLHLGRGNNLLAPLSELQACVLLPQLDALEVRNRRRLANVERLAQELTNVPGVRCFTVQTSGRPAFYKVGLQLDAATFGTSRSMLVKAMRAEGIALDEGFRALHVGRSRSRWRSAGSLSETERCHHGCLVLHHPILLGSEQGVLRVAEAFHRIHRFAKVLEDPPK